LILVEEPMAQVTIYLDPEVAEKARRAARSNKLSLSKWISELIRERTRDSWPDSVRSLAGAWSADCPAAEEMRRSLGRDVPREEL
jgi:hypothetical protein